MKTDTKSRILKAAIKVFSRKGFRGATVREIVSQAGAHNLNSVVYYFGSKEELYKEVLEFMFEDAKKFLPEESQSDYDGADPREKLKEFVRTYLKILYVIDTELDADLAAIFSKEIANPSPFLDEMVKRHITPGHEILQSIILGIIGENTSSTVVRECEASIMGQIYYHLFAWPLIIRCYPNHPSPHSQINELANHITRFSLGGLMKILDDMHPKINNCHQH